MPHNRFYHPENFAGNKSFLLSLEESKHAKVFRLGENDLCEVVNGKGELAEAKILSNSKKGVELQILSSQKKEKTSFFLLVVGNMKLAKLELIVRMGTEIGVDQFLFYDAALSEKLGLSPSQKNRLNQIAISALKQSGNLFLPEISYFASLKKVPLFSEYTYFYGDPTSSKTPFEKPIKSGCIIGPEKGFSESEIAYLTLKAHPIFLSSQVLRAETAAITASALFCF